MAKTNKKTKIQRNKHGSQINKTRKIPKRIGLAKYIQTDRKINKKPDAIRSQDEKEEKPKPKTQITASAKSNRKNLSLVDRCKLQMSSSLLRLMDETLYNSDSKNVNLDKEKFLAYHDAYASVCDKWPTKPIDYIVKFIKKRLLVKRPLKKFKFADIGCGREPLLKMKLPPKAVVLSFDLVSAHEDVIEANMEKLPVADESINCVVYSLSLMAKNLGAIILEGKRILKSGGSMLIVEVTSRFEGNEKRFTGKVEKLGWKQKSIKQLEPNGYFTFFHFTKVDPKMEYPNSCMNIELKPCVYKSR